MSFLLLDTHLLLWTAAGSPKLSAECRALLEDPGSTPAFSAASIWEVVIKNGLGREDFRVDARRLRRGLLDAGYREIAVTSEHVLAIGQLLPIHKDPFDRLLIAQAQTEGATLLTVDPLVARYAGPVRLMA